MSVSVFAKIRQILALLLLVGGGQTLSTQRSAAQVCDRGELLEVLDYAGSRFPVTNSGVSAPFYWATNGPYQFYTVYRHSQYAAMSDVHVGVGGFAGDELRITGEFYSRFMYPGGLDVYGFPASDSTACAAANRIYRVSASDYFDSSGDVSPTERIYNWPADLGAPVLDGDGIIGNYNVDGGDRPALVGDEMAWWKMNDGGRLHIAIPEGDFARNVGLDVEVLVSRSRISSRIDLTLFRYDIRYVGETPLDSTVVYVFGDPNSGHPFDDYFASDSLAGLGYSYSRRNDLRLGNDAPSVGLFVLRGPLVDDDGIDNDGDGLADQAGEELRPTMISGFTESNEFAKTHTAYIVARTGCQPGRAMFDRIGCATVGYVDSATKRVRFWAPDDPIKDVQWESESIPYWRRATVSMSPFSWRPGTTKTIEFAVIWVRGDNNLDSAHDIRGFANNFLLIRDDLYRPTRPLPVRPDNLVPIEGYSVSTPYPNPAANTVNLSISLQSEELVEFKLFNSIGQMILTHDAVLGPGTNHLALDVSDLSPGVVFYLAKIGPATRTGPLVLAK